MPIRGIFFLLLATNRVSIISTIGKGPNMSIGDIVEANNGSHGVIVAVEMMYPGHPQSPVGRVKVEWLSDAPHWWRRGLMFGTSALNRVVSRAKG